MRVDNRGVSATLGIVLLFAVVIAGMVAVVTMGATALDDTQEQLDTSRAEKALTQFDSKSAMVALGGTSNQGSALVGDGYHVKDDAGWMNVTVENTTSGDVATVTNVTLGAVVYENGNTSLAYQGGGVWRQGNGEARMLSPPEFHYRNRTLTHPIITVDGNASVNGDVDISPNGTTRTRFPNANVDENFTNPLRNGKVQVTVQSDYYEAWGAYFEQRTSGDSTVDHDNETATATLVVPVNSNVENAFTISGSAGFGGGVGVDSYDSRDSPGSGSVTHEGYSKNTGGDVFATGGTSGFGSGTVNGDVYVDGDYDVSGGATVEGDIVATGNVYVGNDVKGDIVTDGDVIVTSGGVSFCSSCEVRAAGDLLDSNGGNTYEGDIHVGGEIDVDGGGSSLAASGSMTAGDTVYVTNNNGGTVTQYASPPDTSRTSEATSSQQQMPDPSGEVSQALSRYKNNNDNDTAAFDDFDGGNNADDELTAGEYYYDGDLTYSGNPSLTFDTNGGDITLVVDGDFDGSNVDIDIQGDNRVHMYVTGNAETSGSASVRNDEGRGDQFWLYTADPSRDTYIQGNGFYGVVYSESTVDLGGGTNVYGAIVADEAGVTGGQNIYYDERLQDTDVFSDSSIPSISYLHVSVNRINVTSR